MSIHLLESTSKQPTTWEAFAEDLLRRDLHTQRGWLGYKCVLCGFEITELTKERKKASLYALHTVECPVHHAWTLLHKQ